MHLRGVVLVQAQGQFLKDL